jgi:molybdenum cofactor cytidylyltransferase
MICAILLAAGRSRRMGTQKLLLPFGGSTVIARVVDAFLGAQINTVVVVVRPEDQAIHSALGARPITFTTNADPASDMLGSLRCGLRALPSNASVIVACPGDMPALHSGLVSRMLEAFLVCGRGILVPVHRGRRGHPLFFASHYQQEILASYDGIGLRGLLQARPADVIEWPTEEAAVVQDLDTPTDYLAI